MKTAKPAKPVSADADAFEVGPHDPASASDDYVFYVTIAVYKDAYLPVCFVRQFSQLARKFLGDDVTRGYALLTELLKAMDLAGFESLSVTLDAANTCSLPTANNFCCVSIVYL